MPILNHINLPVPDPRETADFFEEIFAFYTAFEKDRENFIVLLSDDGSFALTLQRLASDESYPNGFHVGFHQPDKATVVAMQQRIQRMGYDSPDAANIRTHQAFGFYMNAPGNVQVEVSTMLISLEDYAKAKLQTA